MKFNVLVVKNDLWALNLYLFIIYYYFIFFK